jgi:hypothetical protein
MVKDFEIINTKEFIFELNGADIQTDKTFNLRMTDIERIKELEQLFNIKINIIWKYNIYENNSDSYELIKAKNLARDIGIKLEFIKTSFIPRNLAQVENIINSKY